MSQSMKTNALKPVSKLSYTDWKTKFKNASIIKAKSLVKKPFTKSYKKLSQQNTSMAGETTLNRDSYKNVVASTIDKKLVQKTAPSKKSMKPMAFTQAQTQNYL